MEQAKSSQYAQFTEGTQAALADVERIKILQREGEEVPLQRELGAYFKVAICLQYEASRTRDKDQKSQLLDASRANFEKALDAFDALDNSTDTSKYLREHLKGFRARILNAITELS